MANKLKEVTLNPPLFLTIGFGLLILTGGSLLNLGIFSKSGESIGFINALFTAGSAACVTGLTVVNTAEYWNIGGQIIIILLIQIGGLGIMTLATLFPMIMRKRIGLTSRQIIKEQLNVETLSGMVKLLQYVLIFSIAVELIGAFLMSFVFVPEHGIIKGIWFSLFHSISAFCNAGFDIIGDSIVPYQNNFIINFAIMMLIIIGGLGFSVSSEIINKRDFRNFSVHSKLVIITTIILIFSGALVFFLVESYNPATLQGRGLYPKLIQSFFQSVVTRTAGYYSINIATIRDTSAVLMIMLMFIGGSPGSTAGGLKTTTFGILFSSMISTIRGEENVVIFRKKVPVQAIIKSLALVLISLSLIMGISFALTFTEAFEFIDIMFEVVSAYATVGLTRGITPELSQFGKILIILTMYIGRIGPLTMAFAFGRKAKVSNLNYPDANISVG